MLSQKEYDLRELLGHNDKEFVPNITWYCPGFKMTVYKGGNIRVHPKCNPNYIAEKFWYIMGKSWEQNSIFYSDYKIIIEGTCITLSKNKKAYYTNVTASNKEKEIFEAIAKARPVDINGVWSSG